MIRIALLFWLGIGQVFAQTSRTIPNPQIPTRTGPVVQREVSVERISQYLQKLKANSRARSGIDRQLLARRQHTLRSQRAEQRLNSKRQIFQNRYSSMPQRQAAALDDLDLRLTQLKANRLIDQHRIWFLEQVRQKLSQSDLGPNSSTVSTLKVEIQTRKNEMRRSMLAMLSPIETRATDPRIKRQVAIMKARINQKLPE